MLSRTLKQVVSFSACAQVPALQGGQEASPARSRQSAVLDARRSMVIASRQSRMGDGRKSMVLGALRNCCVSS